jgi:hypothetical protein
MRRPMFGYETFIPFFSFLEIQMMPHKHKSNSIGYNFVDFMYREVLSKKNKIYVPYLVLFCDKIIDVDNISWISTNCYIVQDFA